MLLAQKFKTREAALKRARFETAHSKAHFYTAVRCYPNHEPDILPHDDGRLLRGEYSWRVQRTHGLRASQLLG